MVKKRINKRDPNEEADAEYDDTDDDMDDDMEDIDINAVTDSEEEYTETERKLLKKVRAQRTTENYDSEDEVYGLQSSEEEEEDDDQQDSMESDIEKAQEDYDDIPNDRAWGNKKRTYYSSDFKYTDYAVATQRDIANADMENTEGRRLNLRSMEEFLDIDDLNLTAKSTDDSKSLEEDSKKQQKVKNEDIFMAFINNLKECMTEIKDILVPFLELVENGTCPNCDAVDFIRTKYHIMLNYCVNLSFCSMMKVKELPVNSHPIMQRLAQYQQLLNQLESRQGNLLEQVADTIKAVKENKPLYTISDGIKISQIKINKKSAQSTNLSKKLLARQKETAIKSKEQLKLNKLSNINEDINEANIDEDIDEANIDEDKDMIEKYDGESIEEDNAIEDMDEGAKRAITYEMAKNRGLTPYRKKELRNPRVKHRNKYRKALIRRKGAVREVRKELTRYAGEISGIKAGAKRGIKLK